MNHQSTGERYKFGFEVDTPPVERLPWSSARVVRLTETGCVLQVGKNQHVNWIDIHDGVWYMFLADENVEQRLMDNISEMKCTTPDLFKRIFADDTTAEERATLTPMEVDECLLRHLILKHELNAGQEQALRLSTALPLSLVQGPPGTGKTTVIAALVEYFICVYQRSVVSAPTHQAVDNALRRLLKKNVPGKKTRLGHDSSVDSDFHAYIPDIAVHHTGCSYRNKWFKDHVNDYVDTCNIVLGTPLAVHGVSSPATVLDEASQAHEAATVSILQSDLKQLVLVGDHKQLGPVCSQRAAARGMAVSTMERLYHRNVPHTMLTKQYRMHASIMSLPSQLFYNGKLQCGVPDLLPADVFDIFCGNATFFVDVEFGREHLDATNSCSNDLEVEIVLDYVWEFRRRGYENWQMGVMTFYNAQRKKISERLAKMSPADSLNMCHDSVKVANVDSWQGQEREIRA